jgi:hypothetical protein
VIDLVVAPGPAVTKDTFLAGPGHAIALDGYVFGPPFLVVDGARGPYRNFNHHEVVDRSCTSSTCEQARRAVLLGIYDLFQQRGERHATLYVNDCDQDVCLSTWILMNPERAAEPLVRVMSQIVDLLDMSAGSFPMPHTRDLLGEVRWCFEPYVRARPALSMLDALAMRELISDVHHRIDHFVIGRAEALPLQGTYDVVGGGALAGGTGSWVLARVTHQNARERMVAAGVRAAVELFGEREVSVDVAGRTAPEKRWFYTVWRRSEYIVGFPVATILAALNVAEGFTPVDVTGWGGAENVGGSPRARGSRLAPADVERIVADVLARS